MMVKIKINKKDVDIAPQTTILDQMRKDGGHLPAFCHADRIDPYGSCRMCLVESGDRLFAGCNHMPREGEDISTQTGKLVDARRINLELMLSDHYGDCIGPCQKGCPAHSDVQGYVALIAAGKYTEAIQLMKEKYILPAALGRVCPAFCENECRRGLVEDPIATRQVKRFVADWDLKNGPWMPDIPASTGKKVAIIGGGPSGLSCAYYSRIKGHDVTIIEAMPKLGGMMRYGIPSYRLPRDVLDADIKTVTDLGIKVKTGTRLGKDVTMDELCKEYDSVYMAIGAWVSSKMKVEGEELPGVLHGIDFLGKINRKEKVDIGKNVIVVGGGNTAMDVARTSRRLGADVTLVYRRSRDEMPANPAEVEEAEEEGIKFMFLCNPAKIHGTGKVEKLELVKMELRKPDNTGRPKPFKIEGSNFQIDADNVFIAIGQKADEELVAKCGFKSEHGRTLCDKTTLQTENPKVFTGGDQMLGAATVIEGIENGRRASVMMDMFMRGKLDSVKNVLDEPSKHIEEIYADDELFEVLSDFKAYYHWKNVTREDYKDVEKVPRARVKLRPADERICDFNEVEPVMTPADVANEGSRCMSCGCMEVFRCKLREFSTVYEAKQGTFVGEQNRTPMDESHSAVTQDNNKCILCGQCVNLTQEITGEGIVDYLNRGFKTMISTPVGDNLSQSSGKFIGDLIDVCPTGAFAERLPHVKPGPWNTESVPSVCNGCGMGCEMNIEVYKNDAVRVSSKYDGWNEGHVCDYGRFERKWRDSNDAAVTKDGKKMTATEVKALVATKKSDMAIVIGSDCTNEEAKEIAAIAKSAGIACGALFKEGISTAKYSDIAAAKKILCTADVSKYPVLGLLLYKAKKNGAELVEKDYDIAILEAPAKPTDKPTIILHRGINEVGLITTGIGAVPKAANYLVVGSLASKLDGFAMVMGRSKHADVTLPYTGWAAKDGTITNSEGTALKVNPAVKGGIGAAAALKELLGQ